MVDVDVVVIGGGPAGATAGAILAKEGFAVTILERESFPRHHIGESLQPAAFQMLDLHLGLDAKMRAAGFQRKFGALYEWGRTNERWSVLFDDRLDADLPGLTPETLRAGDYEHAWHVERSRFDAILLDEARERGATVLQAEALGPVMEEGRVVGCRIRDAEGERELRSRFVIDASGQRCLMGRRLGLVRNHEGLRSTAVYGYFDGCGGLEGALGRDATLIVSIPEGWVWFIPISEQRTSVGLVTDVRTRVDEATFLDAVRRSKVPVEGGVLVDDDFGERLRQIRDWSYALAHVSGPGWLAVGDAAGFVDPILSGGTELAIRAACNAAITVAKALSNEGWDADEAVREYDEQFRREYNAYLRLARYWYGNNRSVDGFYWEARRQIPLDGGSVDTPLRAFVYLTSGRYGADKHFKVFIEWQERKIFERLGVDKASLRAAIEVAKRRIVHADA